MNIFVIANIAYTYTYNTCSLFSLAERTDIYLTMITNFQWLNNRNRKTDERVDRVRLYKNEEFKFIW